MADDFAQAWASAEVGLRRSLELAHTALLAGGLPVGAVVLSGDGTIAAEGRNRAYDPPGGSDALQRTPIAHAEMNALATVDTDAELAAMTLWSTHRPCEMCAAACRFVGIGTVRFVAPDPSDDDHTDTDGVDHRWAVVANLLFLTGVRAYSGPSSPMLAAARSFEPEVSDLLGSTPSDALYGTSLDRSLQPMWSHVMTAADQRATRIGR